MMASEKSESEPRTLEQIKLDIETQRDTAQSRITINRESIKRMHLLIAADLALIASLPRPPIKRTKKSAE